MDKKSPFFTASVASIIYFLTFVTLKYLLPVHKENSVIEIDWVGALFGAAIFWMVIFVVHQILKRQHSE